MEPSALCILLVTSMLVSTVSAQFRRRPSPYKAFSGLRVSEQSVRQVYYHDQTVAVVELGPASSLLNCELIEVYQPEEAQDALKNLTTISRPINITFSEMLNLMEQCQSLDSSNVSTNENKAAEVRAQRTLGGMSLFSGILPGTKWCGLGNIAETYHDLGTDKDMDKCCRNHDICPVKVQPYDSRYNLTNHSFYTKSHCTCDQKLYKCLKATSNPTADTMGAFYFNVLRVQCIQDLKPDRCNDTDCVKVGPSLTANRRFRKTLKSY